MHYYSVFCRHFHDVAVIVSMVYVQWLPPLLVVVRVRPVHVVIGRSWRLLVCEYKCGGINATTTNSICNSRMKNHNHTMALLYIRIIPLCFTSVGHKYSYIYCSTSINIDRSVRKGDHSVIWRCPNDRMPDYIHWYNGPMKCYLRILAPPPLAFPWCGQMCGWSVTVVSL